MELRSIGENVEFKRLTDLKQLFGVLKNLQEQLLASVRGTTDAMKRADVGAMRDLQQQQRMVVEQLEEREGLRRQLMDGIGRELNLPARSARALSVSQLAARLPEAQRTGLLDAAEGLRKVVFQVAHANRLAGVIARETLNHLKWVFASVRPAPSAAAGYSGDGAPTGTPDTRIFDTVG